MEEGEGIINIGGQYFNNKCWRERGGDWGGGGGRYWRRGEGFINIRRGSFHNFPLF